MNSDEIMFEQYKLYTEQKEKFVDRSFQANRFYLLLILGLVVVMFLTKDYSFSYGLNSTLIFSAMGVAICSLWYINVDSYNLLIKTKLSKVIEEMEKSLPAQPYTQEFVAIKESKEKNKRREFLFADIQKLLALLILLLFFVLFANEIVLIIFG